MKCCAFKCSNMLVVSFVSAVVLFIWMWISWGVFSWHQDGMHGFKSDNLMRAVVQQQASQSGLYVLPYFSKKIKQDPVKWQAAVSAYRAGPLLFCSVHLPGKPGEGDPDMYREMGQQFLLFFVAALLVCLLLGKANAMPCCQRVCFVTLFGFTVAILSQFPRAIWQFYPIQPVLVQVADTTLGWFWVSWIMAKYLRFST